MVDCGRLQLPSEVPGAFVIIVVLSPFGPNNAQTAIRTGAALVRHDFGGEALHLRELVEERGEQDHPGARVGATARGPSWPRPSSLLPPPGTAVPHRAW